MHVTVFFGFIYVMEVQASNKHVSVTERKRNEMKNLGETNKMFDNCGL